MWTKYKNQPSGTTLCSSNSARLPAHTALDLFASDEVPQQRQCFAGVKLVTESKNKQGGQQVNEDDDNICFCSHKIAAPSHQQKKNSASWFIMVKKLKKIMTSAITTSKWLNKCVWTSVDCSVLQKYIIQGAHDVDTFEVEEVIVFCLKNHQLFSHFVWSLYKIKKKCFNDVKTMNEMIKLSPGPLVLVDNL